MQRRRRRSLLRCFSASCGRAIAPSRLSEKSRHFVRPDLCGVCMKLCRRILGWTHELPRTQDRRAILRMVTDFLLLVSLRGAVSVQITDVGLMSFRFEYLLTEAHRAWSGGPLAYPLQESPTEPVSPHFGRPFIWAGGLLYVTGFNSSRRTAFRERFLWPRRLRHKTACQYLRPGPSKYVRQYGFGLSGEVLGRHLTYC